MGKNWYRRKYEHQMILSRHQGPGPFPFVLVLDHLKASYNVAKIVRSANAFGVREIHLVAVEMFDPSPAKGTLRQTRTRSFASFAESYAVLEAEGYTVFVMEAGGEHLLGRDELPEKSAFVVGHEEYGMSFDRSKFPGVRSLRISQFGQVESLNVSIAASLACFEYVRQRGFEP